MTKSEQTAAKAAKQFKEGNVREAIHTLVDFADTSVQNQHTAHLFKHAIDTEFATILGDVSAPDEDAPRCGHCGSHSTYFRLTDGDVACNNCPGIMPVDEVEA